MVAAATPRPWTWRRDGDACYLNAGTRGVTAGWEGKSASYRFSEQDDANYALMALSPELAERLADAIKVIEALTECPYADAVDPALHSGCRFCAAEPVERGRNLLRRLCTIAANTEEISS
jgi:hypothetical protein